MKKNKIITTALVLMVAVIMSTCVISGTFAKYTTSDNADATARVAKWGVKLSTDGALFSNTYYNTAGTVVTVASNPSSENTVAPGTKNDVGLTFTIEGAPEVMVNLAITITCSDIFVKYDGMTKEYHPVVFTLKNGSDASAVTLVSGTITEIKTYLEGLSGTYAPNTNLATTLTDSSDSPVSNLTGTYVLTWAWEFENAGHDAEDTALGNIMAGDATGYTADDYCTEISFYMTIGVTQVD